MYSQGYIPSQGFMPPQVYMPQQGFMPPQGFMPQQGFMPPQESGKSSSGNIIVVMIIVFLIWLMAIRKNGKYSEWSEWSTCDKTCGGGIKTRTRTYTPASGGGRDEDNKDNLEETQPCNKEPCLTTPAASTTPEDTIMSLWRNTGCTETLNTNIYNKMNTTLDALKNMNTTDVNVKFNMFNKTSLAGNTNADNIKLCYGDTGFLTIDNSNKEFYSARSILRPGFIFNKGITILSNGNYKLEFQDDGNLVLYNGPTYTWDTKTYIGVGHTLVMQHDGNLVIYNANSTPIWNSGTAGNPGAYLELENNGALKIKNISGSLIKSL